MTCYLKKLVLIIGCLIIATNSYPAVQKFNTEEECVRDRFKALLLDTTLSDLIKYIKTSNPRIITHGLLMLKFHQLLYEAKEDAARNKIYKQLLDAMFNKNLFPTDQDQFYAGSIFGEICDEVGTAGIAELVEDFKNKLHIKDRTYTGDIPFWLVPEVLRKLNVALEKINGLYSDELTDDSATCYDADESNDDSALSDNDDALCDDFAQMFLSGSDDEHSPRRDACSFDDYKIKRSWLFNTV